MTSGFRVVCSDGVSRHEQLFPTQRDALTWQTYRHVCPMGHRIRKEAEWEVESFRLRPRTSLPSGRHSLGERTGRPEGSNVGTGGTPAPVPAPSIEVDLTGVVV